MKHYQKGITSAILFCLFAQGGAVATKEPKKLIRINPEIDRRIHILSATCGLSKMQLTEYLLIEALAICELVNQRAKPEKH
jgi:hypothetical protein